MGPDPKQLERPIWSALTTTHASFAFGDDLARRYPPDISPMAAVRDVSEEPCLQSLTKLLSPGDVVGLFSTEQVPADRNLAVIAQKVVDQMVYERGEAPISGVVVKLTPADVPEMLHLAELTKPGPFAARTIALGSYIGIRNGGQLVAMAGERMKFDGFTEISAVCSHPEHRGRGLSSLLVSTLMRQILERSETPFLHVFDDNPSAAALYRKLGFARRRSITVTVLKREGGSTAA